MTQDITLRGLAAAETFRPPVRSPTRESDAATAHVAGMTPPSPSMRLDSELGMVVIEFRSAAGEIEATLPTPREIAAYRVAAITGATAPVTGAEAAGQAPAPSSVSPDQAPAPAPSPAPTAADARPAPRPAAAAGAALHSL